MIVTTYKRKLPGGLLERNSETGLVEIYTMMGPPNATIPADAVDIKTGTPEEVREPDPTAGQVAAYKSIMPDNHALPDPLAAIDAVLTARGEMP